MGKPLNAKEDFTTHYGTNRDAIGICGVSQVLHCARMLAHQVAARRSIEQKDHATFVASNTPSARTGCLPAVIALQFVNVVDGQVRWLADRVEDSRRGTHR